MEFQNLWANSPERDLEVTCLGQATRAQLKGLAANIVLWRRTKMVDYLMAHDTLPTARAQVRSESLYLPGPPQSHPRGTSPRSPRNCRHTPHDRTRQNRISSPIQVTDRRPFFWYLFCAGSRSSCQPSALWTLPSLSVAPSRSPNWLKRKRDDYKSKKVAYPPHHPAAGRSQDTH